MNGLIDEVYFEWLCNQVGLSRDSGGGVRELHRIDILSTMYVTRYEPIHDMDVNRSSDGIELRYEFLSDERVYPEWVDMDCSVLEMLIAFARRISFIEGLDVGECFWEMYTHLNVGRYEKINVDRLFPGTDRTQELWYRMAEYYMRKG